MSVLFLSMIFSGGIVAMTELPDNSLYHINSNWTDNNDQKINIKSLAGKVQVLAFVYTYCEHSCPVILSKLKYIEHSLPATYKDKVHFLLISLDPERDTPAVFKAYMKEKELDEKYWKMLNGDPDDVLDLSALVGVRYKPMNNASKDIAHSNMITVLDYEGRIQHQMKGLDDSLELIISKIKQVIDSSQTKPEQ